MTYKDLKNAGLYSGDEEMLKAACRVIYKYKHEFEVFRKENTKLIAVKTLKEYVPGSGLKNCKEIMDAYWIDTLPNSLIEDRLLKIKNLSKIPMTEEIVKKFKSLTENELRDMLSNMTAEDVFSIYEKITDKLNK